LIAAYVGLPYTYSLFGFLDLGLHVTFMHTFVEYAYSSVNPVLWSIGIEFQFYLLLPIIMYAVRECYKRCGVVVTLTLMIAGASALHFIAELLAVKLSNGLPERFVGANGGALRTGTIFGYLKYFAVGIVIGWHVISRNADNRPLADRSNSSGMMLTIAGIVGMMLILALSHEGEWRSIDWWGWPSNVIVFGSLVAGIATWPVAGKALSWWPLEFTGEISYGIYLWHWPIQIAVFGGTLANHFQGPFQLLVCGLFSLIMTYIVAALSYYYFERQLIALSKRASQVPVPLPHVDYAINDISAPALVANSR
jgi:peptidoglycan/LPS O-acetylase OafA/YrhL